MKNPTDTAKRLQQKADDVKDEKMRKAAMETDIKGLTREEAFIKLTNAIDDAVYSE